MQNQVLPSTTRERLLAALAHSTILLLGAGTAVPLVVWNNQRNRSPYAARQALQALWWQSLLGIYFQMVLLAACLVFIGVNSRTAQPSAAFMLWLAVGMAVLIGVYVLVGLAAAVACLAGRDFAYPFLGPGIRRMLAGSSAAAEERLVAGAAHAGMFTPMTGMLVPLLAWVLPRPNSAFLRYHSLQALIFQAASTLTAMMFSALLLVLSIPLIVTTVAVWRSPSPSPALVILTLIFLLIVALFGLLAALAVPVFGVFAFFAMIKVPRGKDYRYPLVGRLKWVTDVQKGIHYEPV